MLLQVDGSNSDPYSDGYYHVSDDLRLFLPDDFNGDFVLNIEAYSQESGLELWRPIVSNFQELLAL